MKNIVVSAELKCLIFNGFILCVHVCEINEDRESARLFVYIHMPYRMLGADRRIFRVTFIKALLTIKYFFEAYLSIKHGIFQDHKDKDSSIRAVTLEHFTYTFIDCQILYNIL